MANEMEFEEIIDGIILIVNRIGIGGVCFIGSGLLALLICLLLVPTPLMTIPVAFDTALGTAIGTGLVNFIAHDIPRILGSL